MSDTKQDISKSLNLEALEDLANFGLRTNSAPLKSDPKYMPQTIVEELDARQRQLTSPSELRSIERINNRKLEI